MKKKNALLCLSSLLATTTVFANEAGRWYISPQAGGLIVDDGRNVEDGDRLFGLGVGRHIAERWAIELNVNGAKLDSFEPYAASLDLLRVFGRDQRVSPYLTIGAGAIRNDVKIGPDSTDFMAQAGVGLFWKLGENRRGTSSFGLRPEVKARWDDAGRESFVDYIGTLGFQFSFGAAPVATAEAAAQPEPTPTPAPVQPPPTTTAAPADADDDGVLDSTDRCAGTPRGVAVDSSGCPQQGEITLVGVGFETNSATLTSSSRAVLDPVAANLKKYPELQIELQGHTDGAGADRYNQRLSQQRADAVREYLLAQAVPESQVIARGYGESQPVGDNGTPEGRAQNRRVVMKVLRNPGRLNVKGEADR